MSQFAHPQVSSPHQMRRLALIALATVAAGAAAFSTATMLDDDSSIDTPRIERVVGPPPEPGVRYDGGPEEGSAFRSLPAPGVRPDGGPEEGRAPINRSSGSSVVPSARYDGGPEEGTRGLTTGR